ncbi:hypothetical protein ONS96_010063 [Cadophora gregata f. sp. sojae]|nr:hypothetical protein ONS96_010063 [Cadophora gregata f. sp. sojae]
MEMLHVLVDTCGVDVNARRMVSPSGFGSQGLTKGGTALHVLAKGKSFWSLEAIGFLGQRGANIDAINENGESPLHISSTRLLNSPTYGEWWKADCARLLLDLGADPNFMDAQGLTCIHKAVTCPEVMEILMEKGADVSAGKVSPMFSAIQVNNLHAFRMMLDAGADSNSKDQDNVVKIFVGRQTRPCFSKMLLNGNDENLINQAFRKANYDVIATFLEYKEKIDFTTRDQSGRTILLAACDWTGFLPGYKSLNELPKAIAPLQLLLEAGADPVAIDNEGRNALHHLLDNATIEEQTVVNFIQLPAAEILIHRKDNQGYSPFHRAMLTFRPNICDALLDLGADLYEPDPTGATALHVIATQCLEFIDEGSPNYHDLKPSFYPDYHPGLLRVWNRYLTEGGSINVRDRNENTPLHVYLTAAAPWSRYEDVCYHVEHFDEYFGGKNQEKVDWCARNGEEENALHVIAKERYARDGTYGAKLFGLLISKGVDPLEEDGKGRSALDIAAAFGRKKILELFAMEK